MKYSLGIDAGGTYTDAVIIRDEDRKIVDSNKALQPILICCPV
jgi:N-methylhydantoinase A/oxoprolinase/acetone carboxylase beta subunit